MTIEYLYQSEKISKNDALLAIKLPREQRQAFSILCESKGASVSLVIRRFIEQVLESHEMSFNVKDEREMEAIKS